MKTLLSLSLLTILLMGCDNKKTVTYVMRNNTDTITVESTRKQFVIPKNEYDKICSFKPILKNIALYYLVHKDDIEITRYKFICGNYSFWTANGYDYFELYEPTTLPLSVSEKNYFWNMYLNRNIYEIESDIEIIVTQ